MFGMMETPMTVEGLIRACEAEISHRYGGSDTACGFNAEAISFLRVQIAVLRRMLPPPPTAEAMSATLANLRAIMIEYGLNPDDGKEAVAEMLKDFIAATPQTMPSHTGESK
jgi:hypothetical protein